MVDSSSLIVYTRDLVFDANSTKIQTKMATVIKANSHVYIIANSPLVSLRFKGTVTFQDGAGNCEGDLCICVPELKLKH